VASSRSSSLCSSTNTAAGMCAVESSRLAARGAGSSIWPCSLPYSTGRSSSTCPDPSTGKAPGCTAASLFLVLLPLLFHRCFVSRTLSCSPLAPVLFLVAFPLVCHRCLVSSTLSVAPLAWLGATLLLLGLIPSASNVESEALAVFFCFSSCASSSSLSSPPGGAFCWFKPSKF
jgi:hypothetical protein